jgi:PmbA protein
MLKPGLLTQDEILAKVDSGVYVQSVTGVNSGVNPISGDFSVGIEGLVIKNGQLDEPIREATISSTMQRMLMDISLIGSDLNWLPGVATGQTVAISSMTMSGK